MPIARGKRKVADREQENINCTRRKPNEDFRKTVDKYIEQNERIQGNEERCQIELHHAKLKAIRDEANLKDLQAENKRLQGDLEAYKRKAIESTEASDMLKIDILKQQPASQLPDSEVVKMYEQLGEAISSWVDDEVAISNDMWRKRNDCYPGTNQFQDGGIPHYRQFLDEGFRFAGEYLLESLIQHELQEELFCGRAMLFGLDHPEERFISMVEEGLSKLDPPRTIRYLRSENLKGFCQSDLFRKSCADSMSIVEEGILEHVNTILPRLHNQPDRAQLLCERVLEPAFELAIAIKTSATPYCFSSPFTLETRFMKLPLQPHESKNYTMINVNTRGMIRTASMDTKDEVERVLLLAPGLVRRDPGKPEKRLTPSVICVKVVHPEVIPSGISGYGLGSPFTTSAATVQEPQSYDNLQDSDELADWPKVNPTVVSSISKEKEWASNQLERTQDG
ncbi:MAG: hypothetical protein Q9210_003963 [Variospora velana]